MPSSSNPYDDIELDVRGMRALAHPLRLRVLNTLQRHGPSTATVLAKTVDASPSVVSWHLRHLAKHGLVRDAAETPGGPVRDGRERWWEAASLGVRLTAPDDDEGDLAYRALARVMLDEAYDLPRQWANDVEPRLDSDWRALAGLANTRILVTKEELASIEEQMEALLAPYVQRKRRPSRHTGTTSVRIMRYVLPEPSQEPAK